jgi:hemoglobin-like flavoprotein
MTPERKRLVFDSWQRLAHDHDRIAAAFYDRLFEIDPHARELFAATNMEEQRAKVVAMLSDIVRNLDRLDSLMPIVIGLGRRHREYGVEARDYDRVREALLGAIADSLGDVMTPELRDAWEETYALTASVMKRAGDSSPRATSTT